MGSIPLHLLPRVVTSGRGMVLRVFSIQGISYELVHQAGWGFVLVRGR